jgi:RNA polymerase sigma factor (sigma-70 family)
MVKSIEIQLDSDKMLLQQFADATTKETAFARIVDKYKQKLYWHCRRMMVSHNDADDALQETFIKAWQYLHGFKEQSSLYTWLYKIATNNCLTALSIKQKNLKQMVVMDENYLSNTIISSEGFDANALIWKLQLAINQLPEKQKAVFNLRYYDEMPYEQMSEVLETSVGALKASYHHAAKKIEQYILTH